MTRKKWSIRTEFLIKHLIESIETKHYRGAYSTLWDFMYHKNTIFRKIWKDIKYDKGFKTYFSKKELCKYTEEEFFNNLCIEELKKIL